jgi:hypothetical protein
MPMLRRPDREKLAAQRNFEVLIAALMIFERLAKSRSTGMKAESALGP